MIGCRRVEVNREDRGGEIMSQARIEILRLIAEGKVSPEEGDRMLRALDEREQAAETGRPAGFGEAIGQILEEVGETVRRAVDDALGTAQRVFEETRADAESVEIGAGGFDLPAGSRLRVQQAMRVSFGGGSKGGNVILRAAGEGGARIIRGEAIEVHRSGSDYVLTWAKGNLELEVPPNLAGLDVRCLGGDLEIQRFPGPMTLDTAGGELRVQGPRSPFRFRSLGGRVRIADLDLREGSAAVSSAGGEVSLQVAEGASMTIHVSALGGAMEFPPGTEREIQGKARRRGVCVIGGGGAEIKIDTLGGNVRVRREPAT
jgi:hypothetical protein